jgi:heat shock protein HtpX
MTTYDFIAANKRRTTLIMVLFFGLVIGIGWALDAYYDMGGGLLVFAGIYSVVMALISYYSGDKVALRTSGAHQIEESDNPYVYRMVQNMCIATGIPMPKLYVIRDSAINAFATGRDPEHASIAVTTGAIRKLENEELEGVLAHELAHVRNYDIRLMTVVIVLVGMLAIISDLVLRMHIFGGRSRDSKSGPLALIGLILIILSPLIAKLIQLAVSRRREFLADSTAALTTRFPDGLARALARIEAENQPMNQASRATAHLFIANPFAGKHWANLLSTHPPIADRIAALQKMGASVPDWAQS